MMAVGSQERSVEDVPDSDLFVLDTRPVPTTTVATADPDSEDEGAALEAELFGQLESQFTGDQTGGDEGAAGFVLDRGEKRPVWSDEEEGERELELKAGNINKKLRSAEQQQTITGKQLEERLRSQFTKIHGTPNWATRPKLQQSALLASTGSLTQTSKTLPTKKLSVTRCKNLNFRKAANCVIKSLNFHPSATVGFVAGLSKSLDLFEVDGENNRHLHRHHFPNFPIDCARFTTSGSEVILGSKRPHFYSFDLAKCTGVKMAGVRNKPTLHYKNFSLSSEYIGFQGQEGLYAVFSAVDKQLVRCVSHRTRINCSAFVDDRHFITAGQAGFLTYWDTRTWKPINDFQDDGSLHITAVAVSDRHLAVGSDSGVVNVYKREEITRGYGTPLRAVMNLTTPVENIRFNSTGELLAIASKELKQSLRLVNLHSMQCVPNWPTAKTPLSYVNSVDFSPNSGYIGIGNSKGNALLYRLTHYSSF